MASQPRQWSRGCDSEMGFLQPGHVYSGIVKKVKNRTSMYKANDGTLRTAESTDETKENMRSECWELTVSREMACRAGLYIGNAKEPCYQVLKTKRRRKKKSLKFQCGSTESIEKHDT